MPYLERRVLFLVFLTLLIVADAYSGNRAPLPEDETCFQADGLLEVSDKCRFMLGDRTLNDTSPLAPPGYNLYQTIEYQVALEVKDINEANQLRQDGLQSANPDISEYEITEGLFTKLQEAGYAFEILGGVTHQVLAREPNSVVSLEATEENQDSHQAFSANNRFIYMHRGRLKRVCR